MPKPSIVRRVLAAGALAFLAGAGRAQTLTPLELKCQLKSAAAEGKFVVARLKCVSRCFYEFWHSGSMASDDDCLPPYGGETALCLQDVLKGAEARFALAFEKACARPGTTDCPECYSGGDCTAEASARTTVVGATVDDFVPGIFCERADAMPQEQWCQRGVAKALGKLFQGQHKCYAKCRSNAAKGLVDPSACLPPASDPTTSFCLTKANAKSTTAIDKICNDENVPHSVPECSGSYPTGEAWSDVMQIVVGGSVAEAYCGSPSGAFVD